MVNGEGEAGDNTIRYLMCTKFKKCCVSIDDVYVGINIRLSGIIQRLLPSRKDKHQRQCAILLFGIALPIT